MLQFEKPELADRPWIQKIYERSGFRGAEYTFANLYLWSSYYGKVCEYQGFLCQRLNYRNIHQYIYPAGQGDVKAVLDRLWQDSRACGERFVLRSLTKQTMEILQELYPGQFIYEEDRDSFDYLYEIDTLAELAGKKYQAKRNHINRFLENHPDWFLQEITKDNLDVCREVMDRWEEGHQGSDDKRAMDKAFDHYEELEFRGLLLYAAPGEPVAFSMGNRISQDTFDVNFEKAYADVQGAYPMINREFARYIRAQDPDIRYLNREDDMGVEGLRKAKESYHPIFLEKYVARELVHDGQG